MLWPKRGSGMRKIQKILNITLLATETSHIFCCVLPTIFSLASLLVGLGVMGAIPPGIGTLHDIIHDWELPIIITSGVILTLGWWVHHYAQKMDCHDTGCSHEPCDTKKQRSAMILKVASVLFIINVCVYFFIHRPMDVLDHADHTHDEPVMFNGEVIDESHEYYYYIKQDMMHENVDEMEHDHHDHNTEHNH